MKITNLYDLPQVLVSAIANDPYESSGDISVTRLIGPPRKHQLELRYDAEMTSDATDYLWALLGQAIHTIFQRSNTEGYTVEQRLEANAGGWLISGQPDLITPQGVIQDWKVTSVWSFLLGDKPEWITQLNCYAWLYEQNYPGRVTGLQVVGILRDWQQTKAGSGDYPPAPFVVKDIPLWGSGARQRYVEERVAIHKFAASVSDSNLPECLPEERWAKPDTWAVKKGSNKKAVKVCASEAEAVAWIGGGTGFTIEERPGKSVRCESYCTAAPFCSQWHKLGTQTGGEDIPF